MSISLRHKRKVQAAKAANAAESLPAETEVAMVVTAGTVAGADLIQKLKESLPADLETIRLANGEEEKNPFKEQMIEKYRPMVEHLIGSHQNWARLDVVFWSLMWRLDLEGFEAVQAEMQQAIEHGLTTPNGFKRDFATFYLDQVFGYTNEALKAEAEFKAEFINQAIEQLNTGDMVTNPELKAKLYAVHGKTCLLGDNLEAAIESFETALNLNDGVGVKTLLKNAKKQLEEKTNHEE